MPVSLNRQKIWLSVSVSYMSKCMCSEHIHIKFVECLNTRKTEQIMPTEDIKTRLLFQQQNVFLKFLNDTSRK